MSSETLKDRLATLIEHERPFGWAKRVGIPAPTFNRVWNADGQLKSSHLSLIARKTGVCLHWLLTGEGPMWYTEATNALTERLDQATFTREFVLIPTVDLKVDSQGDCRPDRTIGMTIAFRHEWIQRKGNPRSMSVMRIQGDSMSPTLQAGDIVLVNHSDRSTNYDGGIYAVAVQGEIMIKRVQTLFPSRQLKLISDNKEYEAFTAGSDDAKVIGKIVWYGREVEPVWSGDSGLV